MYKDTIYSSGFVAIKQQELLDVQKVERMINAEDITGVFKILLDCGYDRTVLSGHPVDVDELLEKELKKTVEFFNEFCTDEALRKACLKRFDYHNAKVAAKAKYFSEASKKAFYDGGLLDKDLICKAIDENNYDELPRFMADALIDLDSAEKQLGGRDVDTILDKAMYADILTCVKKIKSRIIRQYFMASIDFCNIMTAVRLKKLGLFGLAANQYIDGGSISEQSFFTILYGNPAEISSELSESEYLTDIEKLMHDNNQYIDEVEKTLADLLLFKGSLGALNIFSNEPLFAWYIKKLEDIKTVKLLIISKKNKLSDGQLRKKLRNIYA